MKKEITVLEYDPKKDTFLILREDGVEFAYPGMLTAEGYVDPEIIPIVALALFYALSWGDKAGAEEEALLEILSAYVEHKIEACEA